MAGLLRGPVAPIAWRGLITVAGLLAGLLVATSGGYGYHRDELYFVMLGGHPSWGYVDQPPLVPLLAHALDVLSGGSLVVLRLLTSLSMAATALLTGLIAREFGASRAGQLFAATGWGISAVTLATGHLMTTTSFDLLLWAALGLAGVRALRDGGPAWLWVGAIAGVGLQVKTLMAFALVALLVGTLVGGPRRALASWWPWLAALVALVVWAPNLWWQARHDWPQLEMSKQIAAGESGTSEPWGLFIPFQLVLLSPMLVPVWAVGWWRLLRSHALARWRAFAVAYVVLVVVFMTTGGKPYYVCGLYPVLLAAGAEPVVAWARRSRVRPVGLATALAVGLAMNAFLFLPLLPPSRVAGSPVEAVNYDAGEQIGWPEFVDTITGVYDVLPPADRDRTVVLAGNYGEAGAVDRYSDLQVSSGHNSLRELGPPSDEHDVVIAVGYPEEDLRGWFGSVELAAHTPTPYGLDNDEAGRPVYVCRELRGSWARLWPEMARTG